MRISFRTKIFLALLLTVVALVGGALVGVDRSYAGKVDQLIRTQVGQGAANFQALSARLRKGLERDAWILSKTPRLKAPIVERKYAEVWKILQNEAEFLALRADFVSVSTDDGTIIARAMSKPGAKRPEPGEATTLEPRPATGPPPEAALLKHVIDGEDYDQQDPWLVAEDRLFQVVGVPMVDGDNLVGVVVVGVELTDADAKDLHQLQAKDDGAAYIVGCSVVASSFDFETRRSAQAALEGRHTLLKPGESMSAIAPIAGKAVHLTITAVFRAGAPTPVYTALFISLESLVQFRTQMRATLFSLGLAAVAISLVFSITISRGVSRPVSDLVAGTDRIAKGEYAHRITPRSNDELGDLAKAFNQMAGDLAAKEKVRGVLNKVVAKDVAEELLKGDLGLGGRLVKATLLFADLRGFTALSRDMAPEAVVSMLNEFMTAMSEEIFACKGIVDKYVGDEIIGVFGAPKSYGHDAFAAVEAGHRMRLRLVRLNEARARRGEGPLSMGIGVHTGEVVAGCMGSDQLMSYTCIGAAMNLAARLCSKAKAGQILISEATRREAGEIEARPLEPVEVKGFDKPVAVYEVVAATVGETARRRKE